MKRWRLLLLLTLCCLSSAAVGFWFGFREGVPFGVVADSLPRGALATAQLNVLRSGKTDTVTTMLEYDVDNGLIFGDELFQHPLRRVVGPVWGFDFYPKYEKYAARMADYRKQHPSPMTPDMVDNLPYAREQDRQLYQEMQAHVRENIARVNSMVERYATKP